MLRLGERDIFARVLDVGLVQRRIAGLRQDLVDPAAGHHVAAQKKRRPVVRPRRSVPRVPILDCATRATYPSRVKVYGQMRDATPLAVGRR